MKNITKRIILTTILLLMCLSLSACGSKSSDIAGSKKVEKFRDSVLDYSSGRYFVTNLIDDELEEVFTFRYDDAGTLVYLYEQYRNYTYSAEYGDGSYIYFKDENGVNVINRADEGFVLYTKDNLSPYASGQLLFYVKGYISESLETIDENGNCIYNYNYDVDAMNKELGKELTEFNTSYVFDKDGNFIYFTQHNSSVVDGEIYEYAYMIEILEVDNITEVENPMK